MVPVTTNQSLLLYKSPFSHGFPMVFHHKTARQLQRQAMIQAAAVRGARNV